jgi:hypothetical protein
MYFFSALPKRAAVQPYPWLSGLSVRFLSGSTGNTSRKRGVDDERHQANQANQALARGQHCDSPVKRNVRVECHAVVGTRKKSDRFICQGPASQSIRVLAPSERIGNDSLQKIRLAA